MKKLAVALIIIGIWASCTKPYNPEISSDDIKSVISYLASDSLKGRRAGEAGDLLACNFIRSKFENADLKLLFDDGFQPFKVVTSVELGAKNALEFQGENFQVEKDFLPFSFTANSEFEAELVFCGFGLDFSDDSITWNDFENIDVEGKWLMVLNGDPEIEKSESVFIEYSDTRSKVLTASDKNAGGLIFVSGSKFKSEDELLPLFYDKNSSSYSIPIIQVTREVADKILAASGNSINDLESSIIESGKTNSFDLDVTVKAVTDVKPKFVESMNVVALLPGTDPELKNEYVLIGAHHDHLGTGGPGSGSRALDTVAVHNGADDNASGVAAVIELAEKAASEKTNKRSLIFATFGAEEMGLVGSKALTNEPPVEIEKIKAMFNFDMVGRLDTVENSLSVGGAKTSLETEELLNKYNPGFNLSLSDDGFGPSDHSSFYVCDIPVFFISSGAHPDYHTPNDDAQFINYNGAEKIIKYVNDIVVDVANREEALTFNEVGSKQRQSMGGRFKVTLGIMPDYAGMEKRGLRIDAVSKGKPAEKGGMKRGDIITAIDGKKVGNIYDYMNRLKTLDAGQTITVDIIRGEKDDVLIIQL